MDHISEEVLLTLVNSLPAYLYTTHFQEGAPASTEHSPQCEKVTGYTPSEFAHDPGLWFRMVYPPDQETVKKFFGNFKPTRQTEFPGGNSQGDTQGNLPTASSNSEEQMLEHRIVHKRGAVRWVAHRCVATYGEKGRLLRLDGLVMDITSQKSAEDKMAARIETRKGFFDAFSLVQRVLSVYQVQAEMKGIELRCTAQPGIRVYADFDMASEVVGSLVSNAIAFCVKGNTVSITVRTSTGPVITVSSNGPPIDPKLLPNLFDGGASTAGDVRENDAGMGLKLAAELMRLQGGELRATSSAERGCVFEAIFPPMRPVVLVVDNDEVDRFSLKGLLSLLDVDVVIANNGKDALKVIQNHEVHLIISDIVMPEMDGYELLKALRADKNNSGIRFIALTGYSASEICQRVLGMGVDDFIRKPIEPDDLMLRVRRFVA